MENIHIEKTSKTPEVIFDAEKHYLEIKGVSIPEDSEHFYRPLMEWMIAYVDDVKTQNATELPVEEPSEEQPEEEITAEATEELAETTAPKHEKIAPLVSLKLIYFNTSTADYLVNLLRKLREIQEDYTPIMDNGSFNPDEAPPHLVTVEWCYEIEDDDMYDTGTHFESVLEMPFTYIALDEIV